MPSEAPCRRRIRLCRELLARADELLPPSGLQDRGQFLPGPRGPMLALTATLARLEAPVERLVLAHASARTG